MRISVESAEVATLKEDGHPWDGMGRARLPAKELRAFFAQDLTAQLERLVATGEPPPPPDVFVRLFDGDQPFFETEPQKTFEPHWGEGACVDVELSPGASLRVQVWDHDVMFHDLIGETTVALPTGPTLALGPFGQVRRLVLRFG
jgi:hypothetical protein